MNIASSPQELPYNDQLQGEEVVGAPSDDSFIKGGATTIGPQPVNEEADNLLQDSQVQMFNNEPINFLPKQQVHEDYSPVIQQSNKKPEFGT